jgi:hypothetical protein
MTSLFSVNYAVPTTFGTAVQFADGTSGVYSGVFDVEAFFG